MIIADYSWQLLTKTKNSMLHHAKDLMSIFPFIDDANIRHFSGALSVSDRFSPSTALFDRISPFMSISSYKSMPYCSATYLTATGGSSLSRGLTPSFLSSSLWRESHLCRVFTDTPAAMASCALVIAVIIFLVDKCISWQVVTHSTQVSALRLAGIWERLRRYLRWGMKAGGVTTWQYIIYNFRENGN